jgi:hypothetical protein
MIYQSNEQDEHDARKTYYVDIHGKQMHLQQGIAAYDLEINANDAEAQQIEEQFRKLDERDEATLNRMILIRGGEQIAAMNDEHEEEMQKLFQLLHQYGTETTRQHIESMNIL